MSDPFELLENRIENVVSGTGTFSGLHYFCQLGTQRDERGITTLQLSGSGRALLSWRSNEGNSDIYTYALDDSEMKDFYTLLKANPFWRQKPKRRSQKDDEVNVHMKISDNESGTYNGVQFWTNDLPEFPVLDTLIHRIEKLFAVMSEREIPQYFS